jgi:hypothetical protein
VPPTLQEGFAVAVASPDKDFFQLLRPGIILLRPPKKPAPGERVNKYALVPYSTADFEQVCFQAGWLFESFVAPLTHVGTQTFSGCHTCIPETCHPRSA